MPEVQVMKIDMAPLLAGSGDVIKSENNEGGNWSTGALD